MCVCLIAPNVVTANAARATALRLKHSAFPHLFPCLGQCAGACPSSPYARRGVQTLPSRVHHQRSRRSLPPRWSGVRTSALRCAFAHALTGRQHGGPNYIPFIPRGLLKRYMLQPTRIKEPRMRALSNAAVAFFVRILMTRCCEGDSLRVHAGRLRLHGDDRALWQAGPAGVRDSAHTISGSLSPSTGL